MLEVLSLYSSNKLFCYGRGFILTLAQKSYGNAHKSATEVSETTDFNQQNECQDVGIIMQQILRSWC